MAEPDNSATSDVELDDLKREIANLKAAIAERANDVGEAVRARAAVVRDNPGTVTAALLLGGAVGLLLGLALGQSDHGHRNRRWFDR